MSYKRPNSPVKIKNFFSAWAHKQNCILYKHLYGFWEIVNAETRLEEIYFEDFKTSRTFLFLHFTFLIRASNVVKTWCLILQVVHLYGYAKTIIVFLRGAIHSNKVICLISSVSWSRINIWKCITFPKLQTIISANGWNPNIRPVTLGVWFHLKTNTGEIPQLQYYGNGIY